MSGRAVALWGAHIKCGETIFPAAEFTEFPAAVQITMAAIDPTAEPAGDGPKRATLKIIRRPITNPYYDDSEDESDGDDESEDDEESEDEDEEGEESPKKKGKKGDDKADKMDVDEDEKSKKGGKEGKEGKKGKEEKKAEKEEDFEDESDEEGEGMDIVEYVVCTLDTERTYQQPLNITIGEDEEVFFSVKGTHDIYLTGNYVSFAHSHDDEEDDEYDEDYDLSPSEDELYGESESEDELDDLETPRIQEIESGDEVEVKKADKKAGKKEDKKDNKKRPAEAETPEKLTSDSKKQQKKLKTNEGKPAEAPATGTPTKKEDKKVKFAKNLEQGPTPSPNAKKDQQKKEEKKSGKKPAEGEKKKATGGPRKVNGVTIDDKTIGTGPQAKPGQKVNMRYIGKLDNGKVFDSNTKGKPFSFVLGKGEVIMGWDIGIQGMQPGGERRIIIPSELAYGKKALPGIPANSQLTFDVKLLAIK